jgi:mannitol operon repressor
MAFLDHLNAESERGQVLISAAMIDDLLLRTLTAFLIQGESADRLLSGFNAPLGTLSARIEMAAALGLINDTERHDATMIRKIRNEFAHTLQASFDMDSIKSRCAALRLSAKDYGDVVVSPRGQFSTAATALIMNLTNRPHYVGKGRLTPQLWP